MRYYVSKDPYSGSLHRATIFQARPGLSLFDLRLSAALLGAAPGFPGYLLVDGTHESVGRDRGGVVWDDLCVCRKRRHLPPRGLDWIDHAHALAG